MITTIIDMVSAYGSKAIAALAAIFMAVIGIKYARKSKKLVEAKKENAILKSKEVIADKTEKINEDVIHKLKEVDNVKAEDLIDKLNNMPK